MKGWRLAQSLPAGPVNRCLPPSGRCKVSVGVANTESRVLHAAYGLVFFKT